MKLGGRRGGSTEHHVGRGVNNIGVAVCDLSGIRLKGRSSKIPFAARATFTFFTEGRHGGSQSRKQNTVPAAPFLAARDNDCAPRGREKGPLEELVQRALHGYESFSGRLGPQAAKNLPAGGAFY